MTLELTIILFFALCFAARGQSGMLLDPTVGPQPATGFRVSVATAPITAAFSYSPASGSTPLTVQFVDLTQGGPSSWGWNFGDGSATNTSQNPLYTFNGASNYTVYLTATGPGGTSTTSHTVTVTNLPGLYGLTSAGSTFGGNQGSAFKSTTGGTFTLLYAFPFFVNQEVPVGNVVVGSDGYLWFITQDGGTFSSGTVSKLSQDGTKYVRVHSFNGTTDGRFPNGNLTLANDGNYYGMASDGGAHTLGCIFKCTGAGVFSALYAFSVAGTTDGQQPFGSLIQANDNQLYGMCSVGGANNLGTIFKITTGGTFTLLHSFAGAADGSTPSANSFIQANDGNLYGLCFQGGANNSGSVFKTTTSGTFTLLYSFSAVGTTDGKFPIGGLIQANDGNLYGMANSGGANGNGSIFKVTTAGSFTLLYSFSAGGTTDGKNPGAGLIQAADGDLYGMAQSGGANNFGSIFKCTTAGSFTLLHSLTAADGKFPFGGLLQIP